MEHWAEGGAGITRFDLRDRHIYEQAIVQYGDPALYIEDDWLACSHANDLTEFWRVFDALYAKAKGEATND